MNQTELINAIAAHHANQGVSKADIKWMLEAQAEVINHELKHFKNGEVSLPGIGKLTVKQRSARVGRNPATGETLDIPAKAVPHFTAAKALKDAANS